MRRDEYTNGMTSVTEGTETVPTVQLGHITYEKRDGQWGRLDEFARKGSKPRWSSTRLSDGRAQAKLDAYLDEVAA